MHSGGQRRRVALARAVVSGAPVVLLDEPTTSLDAASARQVVGAIRSATRDRTVVLVTHDPVLAAIADRTVHIEPQWRAAPTAPAQPARVGTDPAGAGPADPARTEVSPSGRPGPAHRRRGRAARAPVEGTASAEPSGVPPGSEEEVSPDVVLPRRAQAPEPSQPHEPQLQPQP
jgi:energy-coupling factor transporter ATP-binding protein EcfA2